jgi:hypothetical protein
MSVRRRLLVVVVAFAVASTAVGLAAAPATSAVPQERAHARAQAPVYLEWVDVNRHYQQSKPTIAPTHLLNDGGVHSQIWGLEKMHWSHWGATKATTKALFNAERIGEPLEPVTVTASHLEAGCIGLKPARFYGTLTITSPGQKPTSIVMQHGPCGA